MEQYHSEGTQGMFEIVLGSMAPLRAVDSLVRAQETIRSAAKDANVLATMYPKPTEHLNNVGQHIHMSISPSLKRHNF